MHDIDIKAINKARSILEDYRAYFCGSLLSEMETHYKMRLEAFEREMKAADREFDLNVRATRDVRVNKNTRKDRKADLASQINPLVGFAQALVDPAVAMLNE